MICLFRKKDGSLESTSSGTVVERNGTTRHLKPSDISITVLDRWKSPGSGGVYPAKWLLRIPSARLKVTLSPILADQELTTEASTGVTYWEGAVAGTGLSRDQAPSRRRVIRNLPGTPAAWEASFGVPLKEENREAGLFCGKACCGRRDRACRAHVEENPYTVPILPLTLSSRRRYKCL